MRAGLATRLGLAGGCLWLIACHRRPATDAPQVDPRKVVADIDGAAITVADVERQIAKQPALLREQYQAAPRKKQMVESMVRFELLSKEAELKGYDKDPEVVRAARQQMVNALVQKEVNARFPPERISETEAQRYYDGHLADFRRPEQVRVSQIVVASKADAARVAAAARALAPTDEKGFRELVEKHSQDRESKERGGDMGAFDASGSLQKPLLEAVLKLRVGEVSEPVQMGGAFHILRCTQRIPGMNRPFSSARREIQARIAAFARTKYMDEWLSEVRARHKVRTFDENLN
jgi:parvulin-like peptidyl-prolyl isomerase